MSEVTITPRTKDEEEYDIVLPDYNANFVAALKDAIPTGERWWDSEGKCWVVAHDWLERAEEIIIEFFPEAEVNYYG